MDESGSMPLTVEHFFLSVLAGVLASGSLTLGTIPVGDLLLQRVGASYTPARRSHTASLQCHFSDQTPAAMRNVHGITRSSAAWK